MARTGIKIQVKNTTLGGVPDVNANALLVVRNPTVDSEAEMPFTDGEFFMLRSPDDLETLGLNLPANNPALIAQVNDFYYPTSEVSNVGTILWLYGGRMEDERILGPLLDALGSLNQTVVDGFEYRPRQVLYLEDVASGDVTSLTNVLSSLNTAVRTAWDEGFTINVVVSINLADETVNSLPDLSEVDAPFVGVLVSEYTENNRPTPALGLLGGYMAHLPVGTSIGDVSLPPIMKVMCITDTNRTPAATLTMSDVEMLGEKQYIFARTRPPKNGLWFNDGATAADPSTALSSLEAVRTLGAIVDDLRLFFTSYINSKVPVTSNGDIQPAYKQVVLDNAFAKVLAPYIESGDISDARLSLVAKNNDMVGTRTWEVSLSILPAPTLRWIDGFVFYVKNLS